MQAIRHMEPAWKNVAASNFRLGSYKDGDGQLRPCYRPEGNRGKVTCVVK